MVDDFSVGEHLDFVYAIRLTYKYVIDEFITEAGARQPAHQT